MPNPIHRSRVTPKVEYARRGDLHVAYSVLGDGPIDVVFVPGSVSNLQRTLDPEGWPTGATWLDRMSRFARVITFDQTGMGLSDRTVDVPPLEVRMDDVRAVMDAVGSDRAALVGLSARWSDVDPVRGDVPRPCPLAHVVRFVRLDRAYR